MLLLAVDTDPTESEGYLRRYAETRGYVWPMAAFQRGVVVGYRVVVQSTKVGINRDGVIVLRGGYGTQRLTEWERWVQELATGN